MRSRTTAPRVVVITRPTDYQLLLARHATRDQARFFLEQRGQSIDAVEGRHHGFLEVLRQVLNAVPVKWRRSRVSREDLARFLFEPGDTVVVVGQDGLVANAAKYLDGQPVIGINPDPRTYEGVLVPHAPAAAGALLPAAVDRAVATESRTMVEARLSDGQSLLALNELYLGSRTHQSSRYRIRFGAHEERHSSSGVIVSTGTGATGWAKSINLEREAKLPLPKPGDRELAFFVREAWPSVATGVTVTAGVVSEAVPLALTSEMNEGGVIFGDGIEEDRLTFDWGVAVAVQVAAKRLELVTG